MYFYVLLHELFYDLRESIVLYICSLSTWKHSVEYRWLVLLGSHLLALLSSKRGAGGDGAFDEDTAYYVIISGISYSS
jgi:hypothetical protein